MSVLIKCMKMPKTCGECRFSVDGWCYAIASNDDQPGYINPYEKAKWCPIIEVPSHGRLIDVDKLEEEVCCGCKRGCIDCAIANAPTVIPADKDGEI